MIRPLIHDPIFLAQKAEPAVPGDESVAQDLLDTLQAHKASCVGMAANMIGVKKAIIAFDDGGHYTVLYNPQILQGAGSYQTEESCLSLLNGPRPTKRYEKIRVQFQNEAFQTRIKTYTGWTAQIIQHEIDHCNGVLI